MLTCNEIASKIHKNMCSNPEVSGPFLCPKRWGNDKSYHHLFIDGKCYMYSIGPYDASSSLITSWKLALKYTDYEGVLDKATYTGNMKQIFEESELFTILPIDSKIRQIGDIFLNESNNCIMYQGFSEISEFIYDESTNCLHGQLVKFDSYDMSQFDCIIHYNFNAE